MFQKGTPGKALIVLGVLNHAARYAFMQYDGRAPTHPQAIYMALPSCHGWSDSTAPCLLGCPRLSLYGFLAPHLPIRRPFMRPWRFGIMTATLNLFVSQ